MGGRHAVAAVLFGSGFGIGVTAWGGSAAAQSQTAPAAPARDPRLVPHMVVHIDSPQPVDLETLTPDGDWVRRCTSPCDKEVPVTDTYRVVGDGVRDSPAFGIQPGNRVQLRVEPTSSGAHTGAILVTVAGSIALVPVATVTAALVGGEILGAILICPFASAFETVKSQQGAIYGQCLGDIGTFFGQAYAQPLVWIPGIAGAVMLTSGIVWLVNTPSSAVYQSTTAALSRPRPVMPPVNVASAGPALPTPFVIPAVDLRF